MSYQYQVLPNGLKWIHLQKDSKLSHIAVLVKVGSRYESSSLSGISHLIEHVLFKGTSKRNNVQVLNRLESVGADLNAYTTKEDTTIYASFLTEYFLRAAELISDVLFNSVFPAKEIEKEKNVIIDEINSYKDSPADNIIDAFDEVLFKNHPLGSNILGKVSTVKKISQADIVDYYNTYYAVNNMVIATISGKSMKQLQNTVHKCFGNNNRKSEIRKVESVLNYVPQTVIKNKSRHQNHIVIGNVAYSLHDENRVALSLLTNMLGGPAMNSILALALREKNGIAYNLEANYNAYCDTGSFSFYLGTDSINTDKAISIVKKEFKKLRDNKLSTQKINMAKKQMKGQLALAIESSQAEILSMVKSYAVFDKVDTFDEICEKIDNVTSNDIISVANQVLDDDKLSTLIYK